MKLSGSVLLVFFYSPPQSWVITFFFTTEQIFDRVPPMVLAIMTPLTVAKQGGKISYWQGKDSSGILLMFQAAGGG